MILESDFEIDNSTWTANARIDRIQDRPVYHVGGGNLVAWSRHGQPHASCARPTAPSARSRILRARRRRPRRQRPGEAKPSPDPLDQYPRQPGSSHLLLLLLSWTIPPLMYLREEPLHSSPRVPRARRSRSTKQRMMIVLTLLAQLFRATARSWPNTSRPCPVPAAAALAACPSSDQ